MKRVLLGNYKGTELSWIPIYKNINDRNVLILEKPICKMPYDSGINHYRNSDIRKFIVDDFVPNSFSDDELSLLVPNKEVFGDLAWLAGYFEVNSLTKNSLKIFKEKSGWWMRGHSEANNLKSVTAGVFWFGGLNGEVAKDWNEGVRPCIEVKC